MGDSTSKDYLIDQIFPAYEVHLIGGPSGSGKTTWALQTLVLDWQIGNPVLGFKSNPVPWTYVSADRSHDSVIRTLDRMNISPDLLNIYSAVDKQCNDIERIIKECLVQSPTPRMLLIEGLQSLLPGSERGHNSYKTVAHFLTRLTAFCKRTPLTIIGIAHTAKSKSDSEYLNPRQRVSGSAAWAAYSETIVLLEPLPTPSVEVSPERRLFVLPRNYKEFSIDLVFGDKGRLVEVVTLEVMEFVSTFGKIPPHTDYSLGELLQLTDLPLATLQRRIEKAIKSGRITKVQHGIYRIIRPS